MKVLLAVYHNKILIKCLRRVNALLEHFNLSLGREQVVFHSSPKSWCVSYRRMLLFTKETGLIF